MEGQVFLPGVIDFPEVSGTMERGKRKNEDVLSSVAELFDLPADVVAGLPHLEMAGDRQLFIEHHEGILSYSDTCVDVNTSRGVLRIRGTGLNLLAMTAEELRIGGLIAAAEWMG